MNAQRRGRGVGERKGLGQGSQSGLGRGLGPWGTPGAGTARQSLRGCLFGGPWALRGKAD